MPVGIALLGAGIFAREEHLPAIKKTEGLSLKAVYSRSKASVQKIASDCPDGVELYFDDPQDPSQSLKALLARNDIEAVIIALPILVQPTVIKAALTAGKAVLSEKPIAPTIEAAEDLIQFYKSLKNPPIWSVGENFRFLGPVVYAASELEKLGGKLCTFRASVNVFVDENDKFFQTEWRKSPGYQGGFLLDGGVHFTAGVRGMLAPLNEKVTKVAAFTTLLRPELPPVDTAHAILRTAAGGSGTLCISFGAKYKSGFEYEYVTENGSVKMTPVNVEVKGIVNGESYEASKSFEFNAAVLPEVEAFAKALETGKADARQSPQEALSDLTILQRILESGEKDGVTLDV